MPAQNFTADRLDLASGATLRTCRSCGVESPLTPENFYRRNEESPFEARCQVCRRERNREVAALRRAGRPVRAARPNRTGRKFGVEVEFTGASYSAVVMEMTRRGVACAFEGYNHQTRSGWKIVRDGSVPGGYELVSPPLSGADGFDQLRKACESLSAAGARVDRRCGLHVHHDVSDFDGAAMARLFRGWRANQPATNGLVAPSRRNSEWARPLTAHDVRRIEGMPQDSRDRSRLASALGYVDRYRSLNIAAYGRQGTVEVRQHQGTIAYSKIAAWVVFGQAFCAAALAGEIGTAADADALVSLLAETGAIPATEAATLRRRAAHFAGGRVAAAA